MTTTSARDRVPTPRGRAALFIGIILLATLGLLEVGVRLVLATQVGPRILVYGSSAYRNTPVVPPATGGIKLGNEVNAHRKGDHGAVGNTDQAVSTGQGGYAKYFPNESKIDFDERGERFDVTINAQGFRGRDFGPKRAGVVRIVTLGASSTFGYYDRDDETYPVLLEAALNARGGGTTYEVLNLGIPHLTSSQILALFEAEGLPLAPDVVTFYEGINDASEMPQEAWQSKREADRPATPLRAVRSLGALRSVYVWMRDRLLTLALVDSLLRSETLTYGRVDTERHIAGKSERFLANLDALRELCRARGILFVVMTQQARSMSIDSVRGMPYEEEGRLVRAKLDSTDAITHSEKAFLAHQVLMQDLRRWADSLAVPFVDLIPVLDQDRDVLLSWVHLNRRGNQLIADAMASRILQERTVVSKR